MTTPTARQSPAPSRTPTLTGPPIAAAKTPRRSASVFSNDNPFQSGTPHLEPTTYAQAPATAPSKRPPARLTYYTGSASATPRRRSVTPQIKEEPRTSATPEPLLAATSDSRWGRSRYNEPIIPESDQEQGEKEEEEVSEATNSEEEEEDEEETEEEETTEEESEEDVGDDTFQVREMSREISITGDDNEELNPETPVHRSSTPSRSPSPDFGEEFTPEEQLSLEEEQAANGKWDAVDHIYNKHRRQHAPPSATGKLIRFLSWILILSIFSTIGSWYRQEKIEIGYCGFGKAEWSLRQYPDVPEWIHSYLEPICEPCPQHAYCYPSYEMRCEPSFIPVRHPFSVFGLLPLPVTCEPDSEKARRVNSVVQKALEILREQRAKFECREKGRGGGVVIRPEMTVSELKEVISQLRRKGMTDEEFEDLWRGAMPEISGKDEIINSVKGPHHHRKTSSKNDDRPEQGRAIATGELTLTSTSLSRLSLTCSLRRSFRLTLLAYRLPLLLLSAAAFTAMYIRYRILRRRAERAEVPMLVNVTLDRLATQAALHARKAATEPWISITQLRDDVMRDEGRKKRERVWKLVGAVVEQNSNVRAGVREGRAGDISRCWEWIGGIGGAAGAGDWWSEGVKAKNEENEKGKGVTSPLQDATNGREVEVKQEIKDQEKRKPLITHLVAPRSSSYG
ncbi:inner nuclear membrane protein enriched at telomere/subtelomere region [Ascosphaera pollenicola]|nr:inner nuclear membrane protein enriched at telomere/subtelomere region [Ascosphaera pollenicola]